MSYCGICGDDDHTEYACTLRLGNYRPPDQDGLLPQHRRCWTCKQITHAWDNQPCGQHTVPGAELPVVDAPPVTPPRDRTHDLQALAQAQLAESRAERGPDLDAWFKTALQREQREIRIRAEDQAPGKPAAHQASQRT
jgi:hypothetical protein